jgi:S-adenosylmethionine hydrolase
MAAVITLTTDFGCSDGYVAAMKGVILGINPDVKIVDISHEIEPQNVLHASFILSTVHDFFPEGTIHIAVVDPGVGTNRKAIVLRTTRFFVVCPDNGLLTYLLEGSVARPVTGGRTRLDDKFQAVNLTNASYWRSPVSSTFHGRDIFAPVGAWLSRGTPMESFGEPIDEVEVLPLSMPRQTAEGRLVGEVLSVDNFGNLITNIRPKDLTQGPITIQTGSRLIRTVVRTYGEGEGLLAMVGSSGYIEIALKNGNAARLLSVHVGDEVHVSGGLSTGARQTITD